jgi:phosphate transport system ATP-binding protein
MQELKTDSKKRSTELSRLGKPEEFYKEFTNLIKERDSQGLELAIPPDFKEEDVIVEFKNFFLRYGENPNALFDINLRIPKNKITAIIGPSGCGKSTLLKSINRMNEEITQISTNGELYVEGHDIYTPDTDKMSLRTKVGMIFQKPQPFPRSIYDNIAFGPKMYGIKHKDQLDAIVNDSLNKVGLTTEVQDRLNDHAYTLSGGQQQRLCIARALAVNPSVILADEPASALDPKSTYQIEELLLELKKDYTVVIVTHNMQQAARISDYCLFMFNGVMVEHDVTSKIFENPFWDLTERYISGRFG